MVEDINKSIDTNECSLRIYDKRNYQSSKGDGVATRVFKR
jgi:hypothetical protein